LTRIEELFGTPTRRPGVNWLELVDGQQCPYFGRTCIKVRKSQPEIAIGSCTVNHSGVALIICPFRLIEDGQLFFDCLHLLTLHEPGNELHVVPEVSLPGGNVDYFLASVKEGVAVDFLGIELQTLDTTGTVWPERQRFLESQGLQVQPEDVASTKGFGINWKMTAKTTLVQLHHKISTLEALAKHLVLVVQDPFLDYLTREFSFGHLKAPAVLGDFMHLHSYDLVQQGAANRLQLNRRLSTDSKGIATALGLQVSPKMELEVLVGAITAKVSEYTRLKLPGQLPPGISTPAVIPEE
jgi:hypothetical protein